MELEPLHGFKLASPETGYGDFELVPDFSSLRRTIWQENTALLVCDLRDSKSKKLIPMAPRSILKQVLQSKKEYIAKAASELEYYLFNESFESCAAKEYSPKKLKRAGYYNEDYQLLQSSRTEPYHRKVRKCLNEAGMKVECSKGETGIGQHELNVEYDEALNMADHHIVFKQCMKEVAMQEGNSITFMAKPFADSAGSSCHIHLSIHDSNTGVNLFAGNEELGDLKGVSPIFKYFLGGWMTHTSELFALYAPTVNSYKRLIKGSWAPTTATWGSDNRTTSFRVLGKGKNLRIECRLPGADANPYLAFAAAVASGLDGIKNKIEPPPQTCGDGYQAGGLMPFPNSLGEAAIRLERSKLALEAFGDETREHLAHFYRLEQRAYDTHVSSWERARYFERI